MNNKVINLIKNFSYTVTSNLLSLVVSTVVILVVPKLIGIEQYGYWQLYLFYTSYVGFLHFGWNDGIYLRYGGKEYDELDKKIFFSQFYMLLFSQVIFLIIIFLLSEIFVQDTGKIFIFKMTGICMLIVNVRFMLLYILQGTNRIKEYAKITIMDRALYCVLIITILLFGITEYQLMIISDLVGKFISLLYAMYYCKDIVFNKLSCFFIDVKETIENINAGIKLMIATIASTLITGIVRFGIEHSWDVATFGKVSLTLSISSMLMLFINAVGIIMFPILKRVDEKSLAKIYIIMRDILMVVLLGLLLFYYPMKIILGAWLPKYADSLTYMALVFPMCVYEGKIALLVNTYLKTMRQEKLMLKINILSMVISLCITVVTTLLIKNLNLAIASIVLVLAIKCILSELFIGRTLGITLYKDIFLELMMTVLFILTGWFMNSWLTLIIYLMGYLLYIIIKRQNITATIRNIKELMSA